jgi:hypothetical protein
MTRHLRRSVAGAVLALGLLAATPALAYDHDPQEAGHPLRIAAYILHPFGVLLDTLIFRPADWAVHHEPLRTIFGAEDY